MNSVERKERRYQRRREKRIKIINDRSDKYSNIDNAFVFHKVMYYADKCCLGVNYKKSTQNFKLHLFTNIALTCSNIKNNSYKVGKTYKFNLNERGKVRNIDAPHIKDRLVHKILSNEIIVPIYTPHLIYDNGASQLNKGFIFTINRVKYKLYKYYKRYGLNGYVVLIDYSKFFENCNHDIIHNIHKKYIKNDYTIKVIEDYLFIGKGIALGIEIAQKEANMIPNVLDHYIENNNGKIIRYMDDTMFIVETYNNAKYLLNNYYDICNKLNIKINKNKTEIKDINNYFKYCKWNFFINNNGKVINIPDKSTIYRQIRKIKRMYRSNINKEEIETTKTCYKSYLNIGNSYKYINNINKIKDK